MEEVHSDCLKGLKIILVLHPIYLEIMNIGRLGGMDLTLGMDHRRASVDVMMNL